MKFDCIVSNAPYDNGLHEKFESKYFELCKGEIVWVSPLSFLLGKKQNKRITLELDKYKTDIEQINGNEYFDAAIGGTMGIVFCDMAGSSSITFDGKAYDKCDEISIISNDKLLIEFKDIIEPLYNENNLDSHLRGTKNAHYKRYIVNNEDDNILCVKVPRIRGHKNNDGTLKDDFYTVISNDEKIIKQSIGVYKDLVNASKRSDMQFYFAFTNKTELYNFYYYIQTDFLRAALLLVKQNIEFIGGGELRYVP